MMLSCQNTQKEKQEEGAGNQVAETAKEKNKSGIYVDRTNELTVKEEGKGFIEITFDIANEQCAMPSYKGVLQRLSPNEYEGWVGSDISHHNHHLYLKFMEGGVEIKSNDSDEKWELGVSCWVGGKYMRKKQQ